MKARISNKWSGIVKFMRRYIRFLSSRKSMLAVFATTLKRAISQRSFYPRHFAVRTKLSRAILAVYSRGAYSVYRTFSPGTLISSTFSSMSFDCDFRNTDIQRRPSLARLFGSANYSGLCNVRPTQRPDAVFYERKSRRKE